MMAQVKEEEEYLEWLKGQKQTLSKDKTFAVELVGSCCHSLLQLFLLLNLQVLCCLVSN